MASRNSHFTTLFSGYDPSEGIHNDAISEIERHFSVEGNKQIKEKLLEALHAGKPVGTNNSKRYELAKKYALEIRGNWVVELNISHEDFLSPDPKAFVNKMKIAIWEKLGSQDGFDGKGAEDLSAFLKTIQGRDDQDQPERKITLALNITTNPKAKGTAPLEYPGEGFMDFAVWTHNHNPDGIEVIVLAKDLAVFHGNKSHEMLLGGVEV